MGMDNFDALERKLSQLEYYKPLFQNAFGDENVTRDRIAEAMSQFLNSMVSASSRFDDAIQGTWGVQNPGTFTGQEQQGMNLFFGQAQCGVCHNPSSGFNAFHETFADIGLEKNPIDKGLGANSQGMDGMFKIPSLRNVALSAPYMHDGRFKTLEQVIDFYSQGIIWSPYVHPLMHHAYDGGIQLTPAEKADLVAFIKTLRDETFLTNPSFAAPAKLPDGSAVQY